MTDDLRLFDVADYGGETPRETRSASRRLADRSSSLPVEPHVDPWVVLRTPRGVIPFFHLPKGMNTFFSTIAMCGATGTKVTNLGVDEMVRCPLCQLESEL